MLCLYPDTLMRVIKNNKFSSILSILNEIVLQRGLSTKTKVRSQNNKASIKILVSARNRTRELSHHSLMRFYWTAETTECIDCSKAIELFQHYLWKPNCGPHFLNKIFSIILNMHGELY